MGWVCAFETSARNAKEHRKAQHDTAHVIPSHLEEKSDRSTDLSVSRVSVPSQFGDAAHGLDELVPHQRWQTSGAVGEVAQHVVAQLQRLRAREVVPEDSGQLEQAATGQHQGPLRLINKRTQTGKKQRKAAA